MKKAKLWLRVTSAKMCCTTSSRIRKVQSPGDCTVLACRRKKAGSAITRSPSDTFMCSAKPRPQGSNGILGKPQLSFTYCLWLTSLLRNTVCTSRIVMKWLHQLCLRQTKVCWKHVLLFCFVSQLLSALQRDLSHMETVRWNLTSVML